MTIELVLAYPYAFLASVAVAIACGLLSPFVVYRRMAFIGEGVGHAGLGGVGIAFLAGIWVPYLTQPGWSDAVLALACVVTALGIGRLSAGTGIEADAAIGVGLVVAMAVGIASLDLYSWMRPEAYRPDVHDILFGEPLTVGGWLCAWTWLVAGLTAALIALAYRHLVFYAFDEQGAVMFGVPIGVVRYVFLAVMALAIVAAIRVVGVILVTSLLVMPGLMGRAVARQFATVLAVSLVGGVIGMVLGLLLFLRLGQFSNGPVVVLVLAIMLAASHAWWKIAAGRRRSAETLGRGSAGRNVG